MDLHNLSHGPIFLFLLIPDGTKAEIQQNLGFGQLMLT